MKGIDGHDIARVVNSASALVRGNDMILSLLARAYIAAAKTAGISHRIASRELDKAWDSTPVLSPVLGARTDRAAS